MVPFVIVSKSHPMKFILHLLQGKESKNEDPKNPTDPKRVPLPLYATKEGAIGVNPADLLRSPRVQETIRSMQHLKVK